MAGLTFRDMGLDDLDFLTALLGHKEVKRHYPRTGGSGAPGGDTVDPDVVSEHAGFRLERPA
jgi:hypothetical protein